MPPDSDKPVDDLISIASAAKAIGINKSTLSRQVKSGQVRSHQGKLRLSEVIEDRAKNVGSGAPRNAEATTAAAPSNSPPVAPLHARVASNATVQRDAPLRSDATPNATAPVVPPQIGGWISIAAAAKAIGINKSTLSRQVRGGAIRSKDGKVKLAEVLEDRANNIDLNQSRRAAQASLPLKPKAVAGDGGEGQEADDLADIDDLEVLVDGKVMKFAQAQALKETYLAKTRRLEFLEKVGTLVSRAAAETLFFETARDLRDAWSSWGARVATLMAADLGVDARLVAETLSRYVQEHLAELGEPEKPEFASQH
jgi:hypothetical protein